MPDLDALIARLEAASGPTDCWIWPRKKDATGRGRIWIDGKITLAHRAVWARVNGPIPTGKLLCHHCDNPSCVNPAHLYVGTHADNMRDMTERRRYFAAKEPERARELGRHFGKANDWAGGAANPKAKLTPEQVASIRSDLRGSRALGRFYGVDRTTIQRIRRGALWAPSSSRS